MWREEEAQCERRVGTGQGPMARGPSPPPQQSAGDVKWALLWGRGRRSHVTTWGRVLPSTQLLLELKIAMFTKSIDVVSSHLKTQ